MRVPLLDLQAQYQSLKPAIRAEVEAVMDSQQFILGPKVEAFEAAVCRYTGANHAIGVSSGTDALLVVLMALGIGPGDAVITTPYTFFATAGSIARTGAEPVFIDIDAATFNLSVGELDSYLARRCRPAPGGGLLSHSGKRLRAIMPVHLFGLCCPMDELASLAAAHGLTLIEDAAQALGAEYPSASGISRAGAIGDAGCFSFFPSKNLGAFGDAGMVVCRNESFAAKVRSLRNHGMEERYFHSEVGGNFRLDALQAAVLHLKLPHLDAWSAARRANALFYREEFARVGLDGILTLPAEPYAASGAENHHIYNQFVVRAPRRDGLCAHLAKREIGNAIYYPVPLHLQRCFSHLGGAPGDFPAAEEAALSTVALPIYPELTRDHQRRVVETIAEFYSRSDPETAPRA